MSINICVLGPKEKREEFCKELAKKSSSDDFTMYHSVYQGKLLNIIEPTRYPEKLIALANSLFLSDFVVFLVDELNPEFGEQIVALDLFGKKGCFITDLDLSKFIANTSLKDWPILSQEDAKKFILADFSPPQNQGDAIVFVDHAFEVKGIGSVLLGLVHSGTIHVHDTLKVLPGKKELEIKSIQKNDVDLQEGFATDRVGLAIRKLKSEEVERGSILCKEELPVVLELENKIHYSQFAKKDSIAMQAFHCLQSPACKLEEGKIKFEKPLCLVPGQPIIFCDLNKKMRVLGAIRIFS